MPYLSTVAAFGFADFNPPTLLPLYRRLGCRGCQFYRNPENPPAPAEARRIAEDAGLPIDSVHGLFGQDLDPSSPNEQARRAVVETYRSEGDLALQLGGPVVIVHPAPNTAEPGALSPQSRADHVAPLVRTMEELAAIGQAQGVVYLIENIPAQSTFAPEPAELAGMIRRLNHPNLRMCFDTGHANMTTDAAHAAQLCRDVIRYLHVHDNDGRSDSHLIPGRGTVPWDAQAHAMSSLDARIPAMLELFESEAVIQQQIDDGLYEKLRHWLALTERE